MLAPQIEAIKNAGWTLATHTSHALVLHLPTPRRFSNLPDHLSFTFHIFPRNPPKIVEIIQ